MTEFFASLAVHFDIPILEWIAVHCYSPFLNAVMPVITLLGDAGIFWIAVAAILLFFPKYRRIGVGMGAALIIGLLVCNVCMKPLFARIRPYDFQLQQYGRVIPLLVAAQHDFSFPSGHTIASFEAATVMVIHNKKLGIPALILACLIAFSRLYLYVHYPTDVIASVVLGIGIAFLGNYLADKGYTFAESKLAKK